MARATYALRNAVEGSRAPWIDGSEFPPNYAESSATPEGRATGYAHVFTQRLKPVYAAAEVFDAQALEAEALWGPPLKESALHLRRKLIELRGAFFAIVENERDRSDFKDDPDFARRMRATALGVPDDPNNAFAVELHVAISQIEALLKPHLRTDDQRSFFERLGASL